MACLLGYYAAREVEGLATGSERPVLGCQPPPSLLSKPYQRRIGVRLLLFFRPMAQSHNRLVKLLEGGGLYSADGKLFKLCYNRPGTRFTDSICSYL